MTRPHSPPLPFSRPGLYHPPAPPSPPPPLPSYPSKATATFLASPPTLALHTARVRSDSAARRVPNDVGDPSDPDETDGGRDLSSSPSLSLSSSSPLRRWPGSSNGVNGFHSLSPTDIAAGLFVTRLSHNTSANSSWQSGSSPTFTVTMSLRSPSVEDDYDTKIEEMDEDDDNDSETVKIPSESPGPSLAGDTSVAVSASASASASAPSAASEASASAPPGPPAKRPRGRPRKHPLPSPEAQARMARGRSKTGCVTCRRRKKKCDETKPHCLNCQKNAVVCEGYPDRVVWKSGRQKAEEARLARAGTQPRQLPSLIDGIENETDQFFLEHFAQHLSRVLTLYNDDKNPFREILLPTAVRHKGLMHSLLCLAGSHLVSAQSSNPGRYPEIPNADERRHYHFREACRTLREDKRIEESARNYTPEMVDDPTVAATLVLCLNSIVGGETEGQYRPHLDAAKVLVMSKRSSTSQFSEFLIEFFSFHDTLNTITTIDRRPLHLMDDLHLPPFMQPEAGALLGVFDGLFGYISSISKLRHDIRVRTNGGRNFSLDYQSIHTAIELDKGIRSWVSAQKEDSPRYIAAQLYRQCTWIYLFRSVHPSRPSDKLAEAVDEGLVFLRQLPPDAATQSILLLPLFLLGCAAFRPNQRPEIRRAFGTLKRYSSLGNIEVSRRVMEQVWAEMDSSQHRCWDWEGMLQRMGYDFIAT